MKFISSTVVAALATTVGMASSVLADLPASGAKSRKFLDGNGQSHRRAKAAGKCEDEDPVMRTVILTDLVSRQGIITTPVFRQLGLLDGLQGISANDLDTFRRLYGETFVQKLQDFNDDDELTDKEVFLFFVTEYYDGWCLEELMKVRDQLEPVPAALILPFLAPPAQDDTARV